MHVLHAALLLAQLEHAVGAQCQRIRCLQLHALEGGALADQQLLPSGEHGGLMGREQLQGQRLLNCHQGPLVVLLLPKPPSQFVQRYS